MTDRGPQDAERAARMCELYRRGMTLQQIGTAYSLTRERVRQIIAREGVTRDKGGAAERSNRRQQKAEAARKVRLDAKTRPVFGCDYDTARSLNGGLAPWNKRGPAFAYVQQRRHAGYRGIEWEISLADWLRIWQESGRWEQRGRGRHGYVMARFQDLGPYAPWNVYITTQAQNVSDYQAELKRRGVACTDGYKRLPERAADLGIAA